MIKPEKNLCLIFDFICTICIFTLTFYTGMGYDGVRKKPIQYDKQKGDVCDDI